MTSTTLAQSDYTALRPGIADPGEIPNFDNFNTPGIIPGTTGELKFTITNRYTFNDDNNMSNVSLILNIYRFTTLEESKSIKKISNGPKIVSGNDALRSIIDQYSAEFYWQEIKYNETVAVAVSIKSSIKSPQGTYFVRMHLNFTFNNTYFEMKSRGHYTDSAWDRAQLNATDQEGKNNGKFNIGRLNLNALGVDGLIPDTSIRIKEPIPMWPFYVFVMFAILFLVLAGVFYLMDEKGKFPGSKKKLDDFSEKVNNFRYRRK